MAGKFQVWFAPCAEVNDVLEQHALEYNLSDLRTEDGILFNLANAEQQNYFVVSIYSGLLDFVGLTFPVSCG